MKLGKNSLLLLIALTWIVTACGAPESVVVEPTPAATLAPIATPGDEFGVQPTSTILPTPVTTAEPSPEPAATIPPELTEPPPPESDGGDVVEAESHRDAVRIVSPDGQEQELAAPRQAFLEVGEGLTVDEAGRAILRFSDLLTVEVVRDGALVVQELDVSEESAFITVLQTGGTLINDFDPQQEIERRFTVETNFAVITATGTRFLVVKESNTPLEWVLALDAGENDLEVLALGDPAPEDPTIKPVTTDQTRWIAPIGVPSAGIGADMEGVWEWLENAQAGQPVREFGEVVWPQADAVSDTGGLPELPAGGEEFQLGEVTLNLDPDGIFGSPAYALEDCNGDGVGDLAIRGGILNFDFRTVLSRVRALDVTVLNRGEAGTGSLAGFNPAYEEVGDQSLDAAPGEVQVLSLRTDEPLHYAELVVGDACFLGLSLTPPDEDGQPGAPRPVGDGGLEVEPTPTIDYAQITNISVSHGQYVVYFETTGFVPQLPGQHVHFFFDTVPPEQAGVPGSGPWILYGGPSPFTEYGVSHRPAAAMQMCVLVANPNHSVQANSGNCFDLP